jgi:hypothetical protein
MFLSYHPSCRHLDSIYVPSCRFNLSLSGLQQCSCLVIPPCRHPATMYINVLSFHSAVTQTLTMYIPVFPSHPMFSGLPLQYVCSCLVTHPAVILTSTMFLSCHPTVLNVVLPCHHMDINSIPVSSSRPHSSKVQLLYKVYILVLSSLTVLIWTSTVGCSLPPSSGSKLSSHINPPRRASPEHQQYSSLFILSAIIRTSTLLLVFSFRTAVIRIPDTF